MVQERLSSKSNSAKRILLILVSILGCFYLVFSTYNTDVQKAPPSYRFMEAKCDVSEHLVFAKTHKTGSTTLMRILRKFGPTRVSGIPQGQYGGYPAPFNSSFVYYEVDGVGRMFKPGMKPPNAILGHMKFNKDKIAKIMPQSTKYVTIVRDPLKQIPSTFNFYYTSRKRCEFYQCLCSPFIEIFEGSRNGTLEEFLQLPLDHVTMETPMYFRARNFQAYDLGLDSMNEDEGYLESKMKELDEDFDLVLVVEYLDESLILLKDLMCLTWDDIYYESANARAYEKPNIEGELLSNMMKWNHQDFHIYQYFNKTLWKKIDKYGRARMEKELRYFHNLKNKRFKRDPVIHSKTKFNNYPPPYSYPKSYANMFINPHQDQVLDIVQRMKYLEKFKYTKKNADKLIPEDFNYNEFAKYLSKHTKLCKVVQD